MIEGNRPAKRVIVDELNRCLRQALGRTVDYWISYDVGGGAQPLHVHGEVACLPDEREKVEAALRKAGGKWGGNYIMRRARQAHICDNSTDGYWVTYSTKKLRSTGSIEVLQEGIFVTAGLKREARELYDAVRPYVRLDGKGLKAAASGADESVDVSGRAAAGDPGDGRWRRYGSSGNGYRGSGY
jgi:hypothetical protein